MAVWERCRSLTGSAGKSGALRGSVREVAASDLVAVWKKWRSLGGGLEEVAVTD